MILKYTHHLFSNMFCLQDTRALVVREVFQVEKSYVESLQFLVIVSRLKKLRYGLGLITKKACIHVLFTHLLMKYNFLIKDNQSILKIYQCCSHSSVF